MKKFLPIIVFIVIAVAGILAISLTFEVASRYSEQTEKRYDCLQSGREHIVKFENDQINPRTITAKLCDRMTIVNRDNRQRLVAFGEHDEHKSYDGVSEKILEHGQSFEVTLRRVGEFKLHDHFDENLQATFVVSE